MDKPTATPRRLNAKVKRYLYLAGAILLVGYLSYWFFLRTTNEYGWIGADKYGRQVLVQTLNDYTEDEGVRVESDFTDHPIWERILIGEPMRTVMKYEVDKASGSGLKKHLAQPYQSFTDHYTDTITLRENHAVPKKELIKLLDDHKAKTLEDFYAGFGFERIELYVNGKLSDSVNLKGAANTH